MVVYMEEARRNRRPPSAHKIINYNTEKCIEVSQPYWLSVSM